jgi:hypothetical protein
MAARRNVTYHVHVVGSFSGPYEDLDSRPYVVRRWSFIGKWFPSERLEREVWMIRSWNHLMIVMAAILARFRGIPTLMWSERPRVTWGAANWKQTVRIWLRKHSLPPPLYALSQGHHGFEY